MPDQISSSQPFNCLLLLGATGDLAQRYLIPSLFKLHAEGLIAPTFRIHAISRSGHDTPTFHRIVRERFARLDPVPESAQVDRFLAQLDYVSVNMTSAQAVANAVKAHAAAGPCLSFLSLPPSLYLSTCDGLALAGALRPPHRLLMEKPIGEDLDSANAILAGIGRNIDESRIFRIDHYLGKVAVQNILAVRFGNHLFDPLWNRDAIESVHILAAETEGVDGRNAYYAQSGALRDMVQSHLLQLLCLIAMERPASLDANAIRDEKIKVLRALRPLTAERSNIDTVRGRYTAGKINGQAVPAYQPPEDNGVETFVAITAKLDTARWADVPFYLCTGKRLAQRSSQIVVTFKSGQGGLFHSDHHTAATPARLVFQIQPEEDLQLTLLSSLTGSEWSGLDLQPVTLKLPMNPGLQRRLAYERLFLDALKGNSALFVRDDEVRAAWTWIDSIISAWANASPPLQPYPAGSWGPEQARHLLPAPIFASGVAV